MEQVIELIQKSQAGDKKAREQLITENMGLVYSMVKRFENRGKEKEELIQIGSIGLLKAVDQFDCNYDVKFSTYAVPVICGEIRRFLRDDGMVKVSRGIKENARKVKQVRQELQQTLGREAALSEISEKTGLSREEIVMALEASEEVESIYKTVYQSDGNEIFLVDQVVSGAEGGGQAIKGGQKDETGILLNKMLIKQLLEELDEEERKLISLRYFEDKTQKQVAEILGVNQVKVSRLEKKILLSMRKKLKE